MRRHVLEGTLTSAQTPRCSLNQEGRPKLTPPRRWPAESHVPAALPFLAASIPVFHLFPVLFPRPTVVSLHSRCPWPTSNCFLSLGWDGRGAEGLRSNPFHSDALSSWDRLVYAAVTNSPAPRPHNPSSLKQQSSFPAHLA